MANKQIALLVGVLLVLLACVVGFLAYGDVFNQNDVVTLSARDGIECQGDNVCYARAIPNGDSRDDVLIDGQVRFTTNYDEDKYALTVSSGQTVVYDGDIQWLVLPLGDKYCDTPAGFILPGDVICSGDVLYKCSLGIIGEPATTGKSCDFCSMSSEKCLPLYQHELLIDGKNEPTKLTFNRGEPFIVQLYFEAAHPESRLLNVRVSENGYIWSNLYEEGTELTKVVGVTAPADAGEYKLEIILDNKPDPFRREVDLTVIDPLTIEIIRDQTQYVDDEVVVQFKTEVDGVPSKIYRIDDNAEFHPAGQMPQDVQPISLNYLGNGLYEARYSIATEGTLFVYPEAYLLGEGLPTVYEGHDNFVNIFIEVKE